MWTLLKASFSDWSRHQAPKLGAALAYYTVLSLAPLVIVVVAVVGLVFGQQAARGEILQQIQSLVGYQGAQAIQTVVAQAYKPKSGIIATALGLITLFISASGVLVELRDSLNKIWDVPPQPDTGVWTTVKERFLSFGMLLAIGFLLLVSLILSAAITAAGTFVSGLLPVPEWVLAGGECPAFADRVHRAVRDVVPLYAGRHHHLARYVPGSCLHLGSVHDR